MNRFIHLSQKGDDAGFGCIGVLSEPLSMMGFVDLTKSIFKLETLKVVDRSGGRSIRKVAISSGASADFIGAASRQGADVFILGDLKYHEAQGVLSTPLSLIDVGHFESEFIYLEQFEKHLSTKTMDKNYDVYIQVTKSEKPIFRYL